MRARARVCERVWACSFVFAFVCEKVRAPVRVRVRCAHGSHAFVGVCGCAYMRVCARASLRACVSAGVHACVHARARAYVRACVRARGCVFLCVHACVRVHARVRVYVCMRLCVCARVRVCACAGIDRYSIEQCCRSRGFVRCRSELESILAKQVGAAGWFSERVCLVSMDLAS